MPGTSCSGIVSLCCMCVCVCVCDIASHVDSLLTSADKRLGRNGYLLCHSLFQSNSGSLIYHRFEELKRHEFFAGIPWNELRSLPPPFVPQVPFFSFFPLTLLSYSFSQLLLLILCPLIAAQLENEFDTSYFENIQPVDINSLLREGPSHRLCHSLSLFLLPPTDAQQSWRTT